MRRRATLALSLLLGTIFLAAPDALAQDRAIRAGTYDLSIVFGGGAMQGTLQIAYVEDSITAVLKLGDHESPVRAGKRMENRLTLEPVSKAMDVRYQLEFTRDEVKGEFLYQAQGGTVSGTRRREER